MITGLRSALFCESVKMQPDGRIDLIGLRPDRFTYDQRPNVETLDLFLVVDFDGQGARGHVQLEAPHFSHRVPFATPAGVSSSAMFFTLVIPLVESGPIVVSVVDGANRTRPFKARWRIAFEENAKDMGQEKVPDLIRFCNEETAKRLSSLRGRAPETH